jgi:phosphoglycolate phosphatase-like HAD superfamily hydrolase
MLATGEADANTLLNDFQSGLKEQQIKKLGLTEQRLVEEFNIVRKTWIQQDEEGWLDSNTFYTDAVEALRELTVQEKEVYIVTTKAATFTKRLLERAQITVPEEKIYGQGSGKKWATIESLLAQPDRHPDSRAFFLEDRLKALQEVQEHSEVASKVILALADWGYCMPDAVAVAEKSGMSVISLQQFRNICSGPSC